MTDTIFAVSSGAPPAAIAVIRVSGGRAGIVGRALASTLPEPRRATLRRLLDGDGALLDRALMLWFPGPDTATGEDLLELHVHGGRAVIAAVERAIAALPGTRRAEAGEFIRRALAAGRLDLAQAAGLADLLEAETESQRRAALAMSEGALSRAVRCWLDCLSDVRARVEAAIDYDEEGDVGEPDRAIGADLLRLRDELVTVATGPTSERLRDGWQVVIAGPPNAGKSSLFNAMLGREAAIVTSIAGTTRDRIEGRIQRDGQLYTLVDTAGLAEWTDDPIEREGIRRSHAVMEAADLVLWVADQNSSLEPKRRVWVRSRSDEPGRNGPGPWDVCVSTRSPRSIDQLWSTVATALADRIAATEAYVLQQVQQDGIRRAALALEQAAATTDPLVAADDLRVAATELGRLIGADQVDALLDALFARFCVGK